MKLSMMTYTMGRGPWGKNPNLEELCRFTREIGLDAVDWVTTHGHPPSEVRKMTDAFGLKNVCHTFTAFLHRPEPTERQKALDAVREGLEAACILGADKIMIALPGVQGLPREEAQKHGLDGLARAVEMGENAGVTVTIEHFPGHLSPFVTSGDINMAARAVPGLRITYDNGNVLTGGENPVDGFTRSSDKIVHAHFKDWILSDNGMQGLDGRRYKGALTGEGLVDPAPCLRAMKEGGYDGYINFEYEGDLYDPSEATRRGVPFLRDLIRNIF